MKKIKVLFDGFYDGEDYTKNKEATMIIGLLKKHYAVEFSEQPEYIFCNVNSKEYYKYDGIRIFCTVEAICPDFNLCDYGIGFEYIEYGDRYFRFPNSYYYPGLVSTMLNKHKEIKENMAERKFCSFVYSNDKAEKIRGELFKKISEYKQVESGGKYLNNLPGNRAVENKIQFESEHKFSIACENASFPGYHTEKLVEAFAAQTIPIYWGDPCVEKFFNSKAFINCNKYDSVEEIIKEVKRLDENNDEYLKMLMEPAVKKEERENVDEQKRLEELENYLIYIIEQPIEQAYRRNRGFWGKQYQQRMINEGGIIEKYNTFRNIKLVQKLRKIKGRK